MQVREVVATPSSLATCSWVMSSCSILATAWRVNPAVYGRRTCFIGHLLRVHDILVLFLVFGRRCLKGGAFRFVSKYLRRCREAPCARPLHFYQNFSRIFFFSARPQSRHRRLRLRKTDARALWGGSIRAGKRLQGRWSGGVYQERFELW